MGFGKVIKCEAAYHATYPLKMKNDKKKMEYDPEMPHSKTTDQPMALGGRET